MVTRTKPASAAPEYVGFKATFVDPYRTTDVRESLELEDASGRARYQLGVRAFHPELAALPRVTLDLELVYDEAGHERPTEDAPHSTVDSVEIVIPGGAEGVRAFINLIERGMSRAKALGDLDPVLPRVGEDQP